MAENVFSRILTFLEGGRGVDLNPTILSHFFCLNLDVRNLFLFGLNKFLVSKKAGGVKAILKMSQYEVFVIAHLCGTCGHCKTEDSKNFRYCVEMKNQEGHQ